MPTSAPSALARSSLASLEESTIALAPRNLANCSANSDTPPVPSNSTVWPAVMWASSSACQAVSAAIGSVAACTAERCAGARASEYWSKQASSRITPGSGPPISAPSHSGRIAPAIQRDL